jgi:biotin carboxyl carrier protein
MVPHALHNSSHEAPTAPALDGLEAWAQGAAGPRAHGTSMEAAWLQALAKRLNASHAVLAWHERGHTSIAAHWAPGSVLTPSLAELFTDALDEATDQGQCLHAGQALATGTSGITRALEAALRALQANDGEAMSLPLPGADAPLGALLLVWAPGQPAPTDAAASLIHAARAMAPLLSLQRMAQRPWHWHVRQATQAQWQHWRHPPDAVTRRWRLATLLAAMLALAVPWPHKLGGQARIEGLQQRVLSAPTDGFIKATHALPGDHVKQGAVLLDLVEQDLKLEREKWLSQASQFDNAYAAAMSRGDRAEASISLSKLEEAQAQLSLVDQQLQRAQLKAPFDGVVIQGDLSQSIGAPVKQGDALMTVASEHGHRLIIDIDEGDIGLIKQGQHGSMALSALPWQTLPFTVGRITPQATARDGRNVYEVEAAFDEALPPGTRPGLMGPAKVQVGHSPLAWSWVRPLVDKARLWLWAWGA